jgi:DNA-binding transcriptional LysR family regulator
MTQPALTHQMKLLQESYGEPLYVRTFGGIILTRAGEKLLMGIGPILEMVGRLRPGPTSFNTERVARDMLRVGGVESAAAVLLPTLLARFRERHPQVALEFRTRTSEQLERMVLGGSMDLAVTARRSVSIDLECELLRKERVVLFVPAGHRLAKRNRLELAEVLAEPLILRGGRDGGGVTDHALHQLRDLTSSIRVGMYCDGPTAIKAAVAQGMGVGMVFKEGLKADVAAGKFKILKIRGLDLEGESYIVWSKIRPVGPWAEQFLSMLRDTRDRVTAAGESQRAKASLDAFHESRPALAAV